MKTVPIFFAALVLMALFRAKPCGASTDSARVHSVYFYKASDFTGGENEYFRCWKSGLQHHRAVERTPELRRQILRLPKDPYNGRTGAQELMRRRLTASFVRSQPTHVYILQFGVYREPASVAAFLKQKWPLATRRNIYHATPKTFHLSHSTEGEMAKWEPLFILPAGGNGRGVQRLCYGIYASAGDAERDAREFRRIWGEQPVVLRRPLTLRLVRAFLYEPVAGQRP